MNQDRRERKGRNGHGSFEHAPPRSVGPRDRPFGDRTDPPRRAPDRWTILRRGVTSRAKERSGQSRACRRASIARGKTGLLEKIRALYEDDTRKAHSFRYALLAFDVLTIVFVIVTSFFARSTAIEIVDAVLGVLILADFLARAWLQPNRRRLFLRLSTWADMIAILSFLAPVAGEGLGFLRILGTLRLLHTYQLQMRLQQDFGYFRANRDIVLAAVNLGVFLFVMTGLIYTTQGASNPDIGNYADALYFTVTTLTTTGFGDITLTGTWGRMLAVGVMIFGVTLFLRLLQVLFRPAKIRYECPTCGLILHDRDAVHCKHCGETVHIVTEGSV